MENTQKQKITITDKSKVEVDGVKSILSFDEYCVTLDGSFGRLFIDGKNLKVEELNKEQGKITVIGEVTGIAYSEKKQKKTFFQK